ncbi:hypothetical protein F0L74_21620 [Chitinophaga agrisoli]|uniref:AAA+ ATPase domain-containing protein n=1 Tax=Chitinophaga agrisoli TaxID=2607653 RepID=A0A5B2VJU6_9BACT|nr:ATP-binding protein [Chitinophaga agrisoli]KAA2238816.1 hypothetical protein F0L74_21620 [Chitinophaga agrisoli]
MEAIEKLLNDTEAALFLGITKELLYAYVRNAPKLNLGHTRKLASKVIAGKNYFVEKELLEFDGYLKEPWSAPDQMRPAIPRYIEDYLKTEIQGKCPITGKGYPLENAHIVGYAESLSHHHHNLVRVAKEEHTKADNAVISRQLLRETKDRLIERLRDQLRRDLDAGTMFKAPNPHPVFIGREEKLAELIGAISLKRFIVIEGLGGIGKTELLLNALKSIPADCHVLWIDVETVNNVNDLNIVLINQLSRLTGEHIGSSLFEILDKLQIVLVFDSLEKLLIHQRSETEEFIRTLLAQTQAPKIIATSQIDLSLIDYPKTIVAVDGLDVQKSLQLLETLMVGHAGIIGGNPRWLLDFCSGHPLSLKLVASLLIFYKSEPEVVAQLKKTGALKRPMLNKHDKSNALDLCLSTVYDILTEEQKETLQYLQVFIGGLNLKLVTLHTQVPDFSTAVAVLMQFFFVEVKEDRIFVANPVRPFLKEKMLETTGFVQLRNAAINQIVWQCWFVSERFSGGGNNGNLALIFRWIDEELLNLLEGFRIAREEIIVSRADQDQEQRNKYLVIIQLINDLLGRYCFLRGFFEYGVILNRAGIQASLELGEFEGAANNYLGLTSMQSRQFDIEGQEKTIDELDELAQSTQILSIRIMATKARANLERNKGNHKAAIVLYEEALRLVEIDKNNNDSEMHDHEANYIKAEMAMAYYQLKEPQKAIVLFDAILPFMEEHFYKDDLLANLHCYARCLYKIGHELESFPYFFRTIEGFKDIGHGEYIGRTIWTLGMYIEKYPEIAVHPSLDETAFAYALVDLRHSILEYIVRFSATQSNPGCVRDDPGRVIVKLFYIMKVICLTPYGRTISEWAWLLINELGHRKLEFNDLRLTLNFCTILGIVEDWKESSDNLSKMMEAILLCSLRLTGENGLESPNRMFQWLAIWMKHVGLDPAVSAEELWERANVLESQ